jgi:cell filamentation protein
MQYDVGKDPYTNESTGILLNLLGITTQTELDKAEAAITTVEISALLIDGGLLPEECNWNLLLHIHTQLFKEIYEWAGKTREVRISKDQTVFAYPERIVPLTKELFSQLKDDNYLLGLGFEEFVSKMAHYYNELNVIHPFREGNGRVIRTYLSLLAESVGWFVDWDKMSADKNVEACIAGYKGDERPLYRLLGNLIEPIDPFWGREPYEFIDYR